VLGDEYSLWCPTHDGSLTEGNTKAEGLDERNWMKWGLARYTDFGESGAVREDVYSSF